MEGKRATGIRYSQYGVMKEANAKREVLLCGGTINSPQILQLSGIGPGALLQSLGIEVKHDLPGVGENLQDHIGGRIINRCVDGTVTMNEIYHNWLRRLYAGAEWILARKGPLMTGAGPIGLFVKTRPELESPDVQYQFLAGDAAQLPVHPTGQGYRRRRAADQPRHLRDAVDAAVRHRGDLPRSAGPDR